MSERPLAVGLFSGCHGWETGLVDAGFECIGCDIEDMSAQFGEPKPDHFHFWLQDVRTLHGSQFKGASLICASPPCQFFSYVAMPWTRGKELAQQVRADPVQLAQRLELFNACLRIQREASEAAGRDVPMVIENVKGAQPWIGRSRYNYGSYHLWGAVPAYLPRPKTDQGVKVGGVKWYHPDDPRHQVGSCFNPAGQGRAFVDAREAAGHKVPGFRFDGSGRSFQTASVEGSKAPAGTQWFNDGPRTPGSLASSGSKSPARKRASALIARIPYKLARAVGDTYYHSWLTGERVELVPIQPDLFA